MPLNKYGGPVMNQNDAIAVSSYALEDPANTRGDPELAARAIAAEDWLSHQYLMTQDFGEYMPVNQVQWVAFSDEVRRAIGVPTSAPAQDVVDRLIAASDELKAGDQAAAEVQLQPPTFSLGPQQTIAALGDLPAFSDWSWAYTDLRNNENRSTGCPGGPNPNC